ncbi:MAG: alanine racemase [Lachnospiraceae bacterium]|nr:alanine racemase [Lachnospiraceae bacterium]
MEESGNRVRANINLDAIRFNMESMHKNIQAHTGILAVVKTDGYGHGAVEIAREIESLEYLKGFAVATPEEAFILRRHGIKKPILILGYSFPEHYGGMVEQDIRPCVFSMETAKLLSQEAKRQHKVLPIHIAVDTGMSRIGYQVCRESILEIKEISSLKNIEIEGLFTHFAKADEKDKTDAYKQLDLYKKFLEMLWEEGISIPIRHCSNSAGIAEIPEANFDMVRAGITLYGLWPSEEVSRDSLELKPAMEIKSRIVHIKPLERGRYVSYGGTYQMDRDGVVATIPVGYGDGYPRSLSNKGYVLIHGKQAPILGRVCMDQFMVDVTDIKGARLYDTVTLLGEDGGQKITMEELGELSGRFNYEFACNVGKRIPRIFYKNNRPVSEKNYFSE